MLLRQLHILAWSSLTPNLHEAHIVAGGGMEGPTTITSPPI